MSEHQQVPAQLLETIENLSWSESSAPAPVRGGDTAAPLPLGAIRPAVHAIAGQIVSGIISIAPQGHSATQRPQPLQ